MIYGYNGISHRIVWGVIEEDLDNLIEDIEKLLIDKTRCMNGRVGNKNVPIQLRDVALAVAVHLTSQEHKDFGFKRIQQNKLYTYNPNSIIFDSDKDRQASLKKWNTYWAKRKKDLTVKKKQ